MKDLEKMLKKDWSLVKGGEFVLSDEFQELLEELDNQKSILKTLEVQIKEVLLEAMEETGTPAFNGTNVVVTYVPAGTTRRINTKKIREEFGDKYDTVSERKAYVKVAI